MLVRKLSVTFFTVLSRDPTCDQLMNNSGHYKCLICYDLNRTIESSHESSHMIH